MNEMKMCLHIFMSEWRSGLASDNPALNFEAEEALADNPAPAMIGRCYTTNSKPYGGNMADLKLLSKHIETGNIKTFVFETGGATWQAGQYQTYKLPAAGDTKDYNQRFFTIASAPSENEIHISTRVGDSKFKRTLDALSPGDTIDASGIEGDFTWDDESSVVFVAGGIGVTPYRSILLERHSQGKPLNAILLHFNRDEQIPFKEEFEALKELHPELELRYITGQPITAATIIERAPESKDRTVYLSGPEPMVDSVGDELKDQGVNLKQDWFPGYTDQTM